MARYKHIDYSQSRLVPINFDNQLLPGTVEYTIHEVINNHIDTSIFDECYQNDDTGAPAYDPAVMLKIVLFAYSRGIISSRKIEQACRENIVFKAISCDTEPDFTTIASFIRNMNDKVENIFADTLLLCYSMDLIGGEIFALDGCKISSNAAKEWSGTFSDLEKKRKKLKDNISYLKKKTRKDLDNTQTKGRSKKEIKETIKKMKRHMKKIETFVTENEPKKSRRGGESQSNITDNESAKMKTSHGVIQGYNGMALADSKHQIIIYGEAFGSGPEHDLLQPMIESARRICKDKKISSDIFKKKIVIADTGSFCERNLEFMAKNNIDAYIPDNNFRSRDERFETNKRHKDTGKRRYSRDDFTYDEKRNEFICPAGKRLEYKGEHYFNYALGRKYRSSQTDCKSCSLRDKCLNTEKSKSRNLYVSEKYFGINYSEKMKEKIDTVTGRNIYSRRMGIIEPVFGNICSAKGLDYFTLRTKKKVTIQWLLFCLMHNIEKLTPCMVV